MGPKEVFNSYLVPEMMWWSFKKIRRSEVTNQVTPLSESTQPLSNYDLESLSRNWRMLTCCFWPLFGTTNIIGLFGGAAIFWPAVTTSTGPWFSPIWTEKMNYGDILKGECEMICFGARDKTNIVTTYFLFHWRMFFTHHFMLKIKLCTRCYFWWCRTINL